MDSPRLVVVFGAGASHDSIAPLANAQNADRPPLANDLFVMRYDKHIAAHRAAGPLIHDLRNLDATVSIETELDRIQREEAPTDPRRRRALVALRFYLRDLLWDVGSEWERRAPGRSNYHLLLERLKAWQHKTNGRVALVSFNYDTILDHAYEDVLDVRLHKLDDYIADRSFLLLKPHGSVNWVRQIANDESIAKGNDAAETERQINQLATSEGVQLSEFFHIVSQKGQTTINGGTIIPAITVPAIGKSEFEFPATHLAEFTASVKDAIFLLLIGWRATEKHFLNTWAAAERYTQPRMQAVNGSGRSAGIALQALADAGIRWSEFAAAEGGFSTFLSGGGLQSFLETRLPGLTTGSAFPARSSG